MYNLVILFIIDFQKLPIYYFFICTFHSTRMYLQAMIVCNQCGRTCMPTSVTASMKKVGNLDEGRVSEF